MQVQHSGPERVYLVAVGDFVDPKTPVDVPDADAASLIEQGWVKAKKNTPAPAEKED